ncbi:hypothetical protein L580_2243 [Serratia fonticola AU-P3(3)]|nr:hypothetical protein L580_2243 [Serratia fonticola AU-P3(3)]
MCVYSPLENLNIHYTLLNNGFMDNPMNINISKNSHYWHIL